MNASKQNQAGAIGTRPSQKFQTLSKQMLRRTGQMTRQISFIEQDPYLDAARGSIATEWSHSNERYKFKIQNACSNFRQMKAKAETMPTTSRGEHMSPGVTHLKADRKYFKRYVRNRDFQSVTPDYKMKQYGSDKAQGRAQLGGVYQNAKNEAAMSNKISSWLDNESHVSDDSEQLCEQVVAGLSSNGLGRDLPSDFFKSNIYSSKQSLYYEGGKTSSTKTKKTGGKRANAGSPSVASPIKPNSTIEQKRGSRGGTSRLAASKGRHKKGKSSHKSSIGGGSQLIVPEAKLNSLEARALESKESNQKVPGADAINAANVQVNNVNYESEGEQLVEGQKKPTAGRTQKTTGQKTKASHNRSSKKSENQHVKLMEMSPTQPLQKSSTLKTVDSINSKVAIAAQFDAAEAGSAVVSVAAGVDLFTRYEAHVTSQIFHGRQAVNPSKQELLQAKRESRALRKAKLMQTKHKFIDAYCQKVLERVEQMVVGEVFDNQINQLAKIVSKHEANEPKPNLMMTFDQGAFGTTQKAKHSSPISQINEDILPEAASFSHVSALQPGQMPHGDRNAQGPVNVSHEIASANELNMFVPKEQIGNYYDVSCSLDNDMQTSILRPLAANQILISNEKEDLQTDLLQEQIQLFASAQKNPMRVASIAAAQAAASNPSQVDPGQVSINKSYLPKRAIRQRETAAVNAAYFDYNGNVLGMSATPPRAINSSSEAYRSRKDTVNYESARSPLQVQPIMRQNKTAVGGRRARKSPVRGGHKQIPSMSGGARRDLPLDAIYSNADLSRIQEQIRYQVEQQRLNAADIKVIQSPDSLEQTLSYASNGVPLTVGTNEIVATVPSPYQTKTAKAIGSRRNSSSQNRKAADKEVAYSNIQVTRKNGRNEPKKLDGRAFKQKKMLKNCKASSQEMESFDFMGRKMHAGARTDQTNSRDELNSTQNQQKPKIAINTQKNEGLVEYSESKQMFAIKGPILKQNNLDQHKRDKMRERQAKINQKNILQQQERFIPIQLINQKLQKQASASKDLEINQGSLINQEFISSFDINEHFSDTYQNSILAISQFNAGTYLEDSSPDLHTKSKKSGSQIGRRLNHSSDKKEAHIRRQVDRRHASQGQQRVGYIVSNDRLKKVIIQEEPQKVTKDSNSISSKYSGVSSFKPIKEQQLRLLNKGMRGDSENASEGDQLTDSRFERQYGYDPKARIKRVWTLKQETQAEKVIEEGSDDIESFASDTPAAAAHRKKRTGVQVIAEDFDQAMGLQDQVQKADPGSPVTSKAQTYHSVKQDTSADQTAVLDLTSGMQVMRDQKTITSATKLRQRVINMRMSANNQKNVWMGGSTSSASQGSNKGNYERVLIKGAGGVQLHSKKITLQGKRANNSNQHYSSGGQHWNGRASHHFSANQAMLGQQMAIVPKAYMSRMHNTKLQKIARPYLMSAGSGGHALNVGMKNYANASSSSGYPLKNLVQTNSKFSIATHPEQDAMMKKGGLVDKADNMPAVNTVSSQSAIIVQNRADQPLMYAVAQPETELVAMYATMDGKQQMDQEFALSAQHEALSQTDFSNNCGAASSFATGTVKAFSNRLTQPGSMIMLKEADLDATNQLRIENIGAADAHVSKSFVSTKSNKGASTNMVDNGMAISFGVDAANIPKRKRTLRGAGVQQRIELFSQQQKMSATQATQLRPKSNKIVSRKPYNGYQVNPMSVSQQKKLLHFNQQMRTQNQMKPFSGAARQQGLLERQRHLGSEPCSLASTEVLAGRAHKSHQRRYLGTKATHKTPTSGMNAQNQSVSGMNDTKTLSDMLQRHNLSPRDSDLPPLGREESEAMILAVNQVPQQADTFKSNNSYF